MRLVVFDMDGTLLDTEATILARVAKAFAALSLPAPDPAVMRANVGLSLHLYMEAVSGLRDADTVGRLVGAYRTITHAEPSGLMPLFPGARELLDGLRSQPDTLLAVCTGKGRSGLDRALAHNGIAGHFRSLQTPDTNPSKPHPRMLQVAMVECGARAEDTVMIGDATFDVLMAKAAGVRSIGVSWGMQPVAELEAAGAARIVRTFGELDEAIAEML